MPTKAPTSVIEKRSADDFSFAKNFVSGYQSLATLQPLNKGKYRGWFLKNSDLDVCEWTATEEDMAYPEHAKGSVIFDYEQIFGRGANQKREAGICFRAVRLQRLNVSPLLIQEASEDSKKMIIGTFDDQHARALFDDDKEAHQLAMSKNEDYKRRYTIRTMYCVMILDKNNRRAHKKPIVLTVKGLNGVDLSQKSQAFDRQIEMCYNKANGEEVAATFSEEVHALSVFSLSLGTEVAGANSVEICGVESYELPLSGTQEEAIESLSRLTIPTEDRESSWALQKQYKNYIQAYCDMCAARLKGSYGIAEGVEILPVDRSAKAALPEGNPTGEDASL